MADVLPYLRGTSGGLNAQVLYPFTRVTSCLTGIGSFQNANEQRWVERPPLFGFQLPMTSLLTADKAAWLTFFSSSGVKGRAGQDLQLSLGSTTYSNLTLLSDALQVANRKPLQYDQSISLRQVIPANFSTYTPPTVGSTYPYLQFGTGSATTANSEMPFVQISTFLTSVGDSQYGPRYSYSWYDASLTNFPMGYLRIWKLSYPLLTDVDLGILETYFLGQQGRYGSFSFVDPIDGITYTHCRFDQDDLSIKYLLYGQNATELSIIQTFNS